MLAVGHAAYSTYNHVKAEMFDSRSVSWKSVNKYPYVIGLILYTVGNEGKLSYL